MTYLETFYEGQEPGDRYVFYFAGHAFQLDTDDVKEEDKKYEFILPSIDPQSETFRKLEDPALKETDSWEIPAEDGIVDDVLYDYLVRPLNSASRLTAIFDTCHSNTLLDLPHHRCNRVCKWTSFVRRARCFFEIEFVRSIMNEFDKGKTTHPTDELLICKGYGNCRRIKGIKNNIDSETVFEHQEIQSMTQLLIQLLREQPRLTLKETMYAVSSNGDKAVFDTCHSNTLFDLPRHRCNEAAASVLGTAADITHEILFNSITLLEFAPVPRLAPAAHVLLKIWDALQLVDTNRLQCLRLTNRCADILFSFREEVREADDQVNKELQAPIAKLTESFHTIQSFLIKQVHRPFLNRYLKRNEIQAQIRACHGELTEALVMLGLSIQIRILRSVQESERGQCADQRALLGMLRRDEHRPAGAEREPVVGLELSEIDAHADVLGRGMSDSTLTVRPLPPSEHEATLSVACLSPSSSLSPTPSPTLTPSLATADTGTLHPSQVLHALKTVQDSQDAQDTARDSKDLHALIRTALCARSNAEIFQLLQIGREEMPEAIKTLQRKMKPKIKTGRRGGGN